MIAYVWDALAVTIRGFFRPINTIQYPAQKRPHEERFRASFALLHNPDGEEACIACKMCENICPSQVIAITSTGKKESPVTGKKRNYCEDFTLNLQACIFCELCVQVCPEDAITMCRTQEIPGFSREDLVLTMDKLYANEKGRERTWGIASKFVEMHSTTYGLPKPPEGEAPPPAPKPKREAAPVAAAAPAPAPEKPVEVKKDEGGHG
jgi:NADH-quinone oxidoreductase subunit I